MVIWLIGLSGSGKTYLGKALYEQIKGKNANTVFLDGDLVREVMGNDLGYTLKDRKKNADRICRLCLMLERQGIIVVCAILSLFPESREWNRKNYRNYFEIFLDVPMDVLRRRNFKGLYDKAEQGELENVVGVDIPFPVPANPDLVVLNEKDLSSPQPVVDTIMKKLPDVNELSLF